VRVDICAFKRGGNIRLEKRKYRVKKVTPAHNRTVKYLGRIDGHLQSNFMGKKQAIPKNIF
jgi:hypothetical protein